MPKLAPPNSCATCLRRKIKCDGQLPVCGKCAVRGLQCLRRAKPTTFVVHDPATIDRVTYSSSNTTQDTPLSRSSTHESPYPAQQPPLMTIKQVSALASASPQDALADAEIASLFAHYIAVLAPWYDLNDPDRTFGRVVPERALTTPVLFKAIIAFAASHRSKVTARRTHITTIFHIECVTELLRATSDLQPSLDDSCYLAATCLLRSYELINDGSDMENHLLGAYSYAVRTAIDFKNAGLKQISVWNYLREEITVALMRRREVRIGRIFDLYDGLHPQHALPANHISYLLARVINFCFADSKVQGSLAERQSLWLSLRSDVTAWKASLPPDFKAYSVAAKPGSPFPALWMLQPWHAAANQYKVVTEILLTLYEPCPPDGHLSRTSLDLVQDLALEVCGIAWTNLNDAARVNAFGPLAFCGRYLSDGYHQRALEDLLLEMSRPTGWPINTILSDLRAHWAYQRPSAIR